MRKTKWAAIAVTVIGLGATSCGTNTASTTDNASVPVAPRPEGTGPLPKAFVITDLADAATAAGVPDNAPEYARGYAEAPADSRLTCGAAFAGFADETTKVDMARYETVLRELRKRGWTPAQKREERKNKTTGETFNAKDGFEQRGWRLVVEYWEGVEGAAGTKISLIGIDDACMKANGLKAPTT
ncbi:hypothetical protein ACFCZ1_28220 [Streptomyces sp. NPDC056224]|uniref:hypothetical protein n=1 Tax=Streptomyces sp. NPDC056224 TaxID=3345750 RepID=UPI0035E170B4